MAVISVSLCRFEGANLVNFPVLTKIIGVSNIYFRSLTIAFGMSCVTRDGVKVWQGGVTKCRFVRKFRSLARRLQSRKA